MIPTRATLPAVLLAACLSSPVHALPAAVEGKELVVYKDGGYPTYPCWAYECQPQDNCRESTPSLQLPRIVTDGL
jgi:hypothetical protein